jgi:uncharacterized protein (DUF1800 family)
MKTMRWIAAAAVAALLVGTESSAVLAKKKPAPADDRTIAHVLNRIGYGAAPGQIAEVREMGLDAYIQQQLHPERLPDVGLRDHLGALGTLELSSGAIAMEYYQPLLDMRQEFQKQKAADAARMEALHIPQVPDAVPALIPPTETIPPPNAPTASRPPQPIPPNAQAAQAPPPGSDDDLQNRQTMELRRTFAEARRKNRLVIEELAEQKLLRAVYSDRQLEAVLTDFWFNHFNVFAAKGATQVYVTEYERDVIRPHVLGTFRDLLGATAHSPAMLFYLDNWQSVDPEAATRLREQQQQRRDAIARRRAMMGPRTPPRQTQTQAQAQAQASPRQAGAAMATDQPPSQAKPRPKAAGLNENYGRELLELHTLGVDGGYTQQDVIEVAKCFTGWTIRSPREGGGFMFDERKHAPGLKMVLGHRIDAGGERDGEAVLDLLAKSPATATFVATKLVRRFVSDQPPRALVERVAARFRKTDGDLREVMRTLLTSPEFVAADARRAKVKTPFEFVASALRTTGARIEDADAVVKSVASMGMPLYMALPPTGYVDRAEAWVNTGALFNRMNFAVSLVNNKVRGAQIDLAALAGSTDVATARDRLLQTLLDNTVSPATRDTLEKGTAVPQVAALTLGSPEFQRR